MTRCSTISPRSTASAQRSRSELATSIRRGQRRASPFRRCAATGRPPESRNASASHQTEPTPAVNVTAPRP
jgi:hypothetical protein